MRELTLGRVIGAALIGAALAFAVVLGVFANHALAATRARDVPTSPAVAAAFADAGPEWIRHMDLPVRRLALRSAEEYGTGNYLFIFDVYSWFGIGSGYMTRGTAGGGGLLSDGGFAGIAQTASDAGLQETRSAWVRAHGPGRVVAPAR